MNPDEINALRQLAQADQDKAGLSDYLVNVEREVLESTPELDAAAAAGLIASAQHERDVIRNLLIDLGGSDAQADIESTLDNLIELVEAYLRHSIDLNNARVRHGELRKRVLEIVRGCILTGWMAALYEHDLLTDIAPELPS